jgi:hypothetical protein
MRQVNSAPTAGPAATEDTIIQIGKGGITRRGAVRLRRHEGRELIKGRVLENSMPPPGGCNQLSSSARGAGAVHRQQFVPYKRTHSDPRIVLSKKQR